MVNTVLIVTDTRFAGSTDIVEGFVQAIGQTHDMTIMAIMDAGQRSLWQRLRDKLVSLVTKLVGNPLVFYRGDKRLRAMCDARGIRLIHGNPLNFEVPANMLISIGCSVIFPRSFLNRFDYAVNYHNGSLPGYRGLHATQWAVYHGNISSGFTFHRITPGIDEGPVLQTSTVLHGNDSPRLVELRKSARAAEYAGAVADQMRRRDPGVPQSGAAGYYRAKDFLAMKNIGDGSEITSLELEKRITCFAPLMLSRKGSIWPVTALVREAGSTSRHFSTADGVGYRITRFYHLPFVMFLVARIFNLIPESRHG